MSEEYGVLLSNDQKSQGFDLSKLHDLINPTFTVDDMKASAFSTQLSTPRTIPMDLNGLGLGVVEVAVTCIRVMFNKRSPGDEYEDATGYFEYPDYYFEGWIVEDESTYHHQRTRVRCCAYAGGFNAPNVVDELIVQIIDEQRSFVED